MKAVLISLIAALALSLTGLAAASGERSARPVAVGTARTDLGRIIVNRRGRTLYLFEKDKRGHSACFGACASIWRPLLTHGKPIASAGAKQSLLGAIRRANGVRQVTYAGHPLYTYVVDMKRGDTFGEGSQEFGASWDALSPAGKKIERSGD